MQSKVQPFRLFTAFFSGAYATTTATATRTSTKQSNNSAHASPYLVPFLPSLHDYEGKLLRDGPLENLWGGRAKYKKKSRKGKLNEKNSCTPINPKKYSCYGLKKKSYKEFDDEKKIPAARKFPSPPHNFCNGPSLISHFR